MLAQMVMVFMIAHSIIHSGRVNQAMPPISPVVRYSGIIIGNA